MNSTNTNSIFSTSPQTTFGLYFPREQKFGRGYEEIDERLFEALEVSGNKKGHPLLTTDVSPCLSEEESDSSYKQTVRKSPKNNKSNKKREAKIKKDDDSDSDHTEYSNKKKSFKSKKSVHHETVETDKKQKNLYKTELCRNWEETGHCRYGMKCQYAHGSSDLREVDRHPKYKTQKCRTFHQTGSCPYGSRCTFRHFNLPGDAAEMKNLEKEEEEKQQPMQEFKFEEPSSIFQQNWFLENNTHVFGGAPSSSQNKPAQYMFDPEDSLLPMNAESLLPHQLLFDLESPDEDEQPSRCSLRNYVNLPQSIPYQPQQQMNPNCNTFFRPWLF
ncbi:hypothetical protein BD560DRAFT_406796 [Blakeslea trispora]|nr:hypothetical protein BD560DRAFT_406796 [Blakeslea trispora]